MLCASDTAPPPPPVTPGCRSVPPRILGTTLGALEVEVLLLRLVVLRTAAAVAEGRIGGWWRIVVAAAVAARMAGWLAGWFCGCVGFGVRGGNKGGGFE